MKFFCDAAFVRKVLIIIFLTIIILLLIMGRFRTMRIRMFGGIAEERQISLKEEFQHLPRT